MPFYLKYIDDRFTVVVVTAAAAANDNVDGGYDGGAGFHVTQGVSLLLLSGEPDVCYVRDASEEPKSCLKAVSYTHLTLPTRSTV